MSCRMLLPLILAVAAVAMILPTLGLAEAWKGVDDTVVGRFAEEAGHPATRPYIDTDQGDLLLFLFLLAGAAGGFVMGYLFRGLFPPRKAASR